MSDRGCPVADHRADPTQIRYPWRTVVRSILTFTVALASALPLIYTAITESSPEVATGAAAQALLISGAITRVMALPLVNELLETIGLGAEPKEKNV
ncbi:hypothetical protein [Arthrobacter sp. NPDC090010]|uniref:hypothetical protein n=1 Tax=Arthrobacter sp. NPDC090010 TaxID=3363942 RepID=UPI00380CDE68